MRKHLRKMRKLQATSSLYCWDITCVTVQAFVINGASECKEQVYVDVGVWWYVLGAVRTGAVRVQRTGLGAAASSRLAAARPPVCPNTTHRYVTTTQQTRATLLTNYYQHPTYPLNGNFPDPGLISCRRKTFATHLFIPIFCVHLIKTTIALHIDKEN